MSASADQRHSGARTLFMYVTELSITMLHRRRIAFFVSHFCIYIVPRLSALKKLSFAEIQQL